MTNGVPKRSWAAAPPVRLAAFVLLLALLSGAAALLGRASNIDVGAPDAQLDGEAAHGAMDVSGMDAPSAPAVGLSDVAAGHRLRLTPTTLSAGATRRVTVEITDRDGASVQPESPGPGEPPLHLILVRRDLTGYRHLHPARSGDGYAVDVTLPAPGVWRAYADFELDGEKVVLGRDLLVPGEFAPQPPPSAVDTARTGGYDVELEAGELRAGTDATLRFRIARGGEPVRSLQRYLGADGHLVAIRAEDLAYLHVHPLETAAPGAVDFGAAFAEPGEYALFLQFKHRNRVQTARLTVEVGR